MAERKQNEAPKDEAPKSESLSPEQQAALQALSTELVQEMAKTPTVVQAADGTQTVVPTTAPASTTTSRAPSERAQANINAAAANRTKYADKLKELEGNTSAKIRFLHDEGLSMGDISRVLDIRFQYVRNVVRQYEAKQISDAQKAAAAATPATA